MLIIGIIFLMQLEKENIFSSAHIAKNPHP